MSKGQRPGPEASIMKLSYAAFVKELSALAVEVQGPYGQLLHPNARVEGVFQQKFFNAVQASIGGGTDEIQRNIISERVLGLPREPR
jgi:alkylation response protein AidB-like acyl-CoA dehydrogenase